MGANLCYNVAEADEFICCIEKRYAKLIKIPQQRPSVAFGMEKYEEALYVE
ncbi:MAG: hypothetical protein QNJ26_17310 [Desulfobacterales bacterium]|nr:hypothetical protein [Desulfobacterales bacterium]